MYHEEVIIQILVRCPRWLKPRGDSVCLLQKIKSIIFSPYWQCISGEDKNEGGHCLRGVKNKFTACIACPSGLACNVTVDPGVEETETKKKKRNKNKSTVKNQIIYNMLRHPNEDWERMLLLLFKHKKNIDLILQTEHIQWKAEPIYSNWVLFS